MIVYKGSDYIVLGQTEDGNYRLISGTSIGSIQYQPNQDTNGNYYNIGQYDENDEQDVGYSGQKYNTINRSCFFMSYYEYFRLVLD